MTSISPPIDDDAVMQVAMTSRAMCDLLAIMDDTEVDALIAEAQMAADKAKAVEKTTRRVSGQASAKALVAQWLCACTGNGDTGTGRNARRTR